MSGRKCVGRALVDSFQAFHNCEGGGTITVGVGDRASAVISVRHLRSGRGCRILLIARFKFDLQCTIDRINVVKAHTDKIGSVGLGRKSFMMKKTTFGRNSSRFPVLILAREKGVGGFGSKRIPVLNQTGQKLVLLGRLGTGPRQVVFVSCGLSVPGRCTVQADGNGAVVIRDGRAPFDPECSGNDFTVGRGASNRMSSVRGRFSFSRVEVSWFAIVGGVSGQGLYGDAISVFL